MVLSLADYISDDEPTSSVAHTLSRNHVEAHNVSQLEHPLYQDETDKFVHSENHGHMLVTLC
jgi:hypothetical protein